MCIRDRFPTACAFVCEHPCETRCRRTLVDAPVNIRGIKRFAVDQAPADRVAPPPHSVDTCLLYTSRCV